MLNHQLVWLYRSFSQFSSFTLLRNTLATQTFGSPLLPISVSLLWLLVFRVVLTCVAAADNSCSHYVCGIFRLRADIARGGTPWRPKWRTSTSSGSWRDWDVRGTPSQSLPRPSPASRMLLWGPSQGFPGFISTIS